MRRKYLIGLLSLITAILLLSSFFPPVPAAAFTTSLKITKYYSDGVTMLQQKTLTYQWMRDNLPVLGDGITHYYHQGPVFVDNADPNIQMELRWNLKEDTNIKDKDMGAVKGTDLKDLCDLVGGMQAGDELKVKAEDGLSKRFAYKNIYEYSPREGPMVLAWSRDGLFPDTGYTEGMRLVWFADSSVNPWRLHVFGNQDWRLAAESKYFYYYHSGTEKYPTTTGLSIQKVSEIFVYSSIEQAKSPFWDLNLDHICNTADLDAIETQWGHSGTPGWVPADVNKDGSINLLDMVVLGLHWRQTW